MLVPFLEESAESDRLANYSENRNCRASCRVNHLDKGYPNLYILVPVNVFGEVSEWSKEVVLKTIEPQGSVGSNPTFSVLHF